MKNLTTLFRCSWNQYLCQETFCVNSLTVGTVLRMTNGNCKEKLGLHLLKPGKRVQFKNINFEVRCVCGVAFCSQNLKRVESKRDQKPFTCLPSPSKVTDTDHQDVPFVTLMDVLTYPEVIAKFRCVVRVVATLPGHPRDFKAPCGTYRIRLTLEDPTARIHVYIYAEDGGKFFGGYPSIDTMIKKHNALLGVEETDDADSDEKLRNPLSHPNRWRKHRDETNKLLKTT
ncbi:putative protection of telomeres protein [Helianthus debilis subsp. tardiflorus]